MQYPSLKNNPTSAYNIPAFNGGINSSTVAQDIQDNQAVTMSNMWLKDGVLQTRPALKRGSDNAYFLANSSLVDLGVEIRLGYEDYSNEDIAQGGAVQHTYRLMLSDNKQFLLYDIHANSFSNMEIEFQKDLYQSCFNEGIVQDTFFYTKGLGDSQVKTDSGYKQTFYTEVYGYMKLSNCTSLGDSLDEQNIKFLLYLEPYLSDNAVKLKVMVYNSVKDLPEKHTPYSPTVVLDYGESYGGTLEDFNLMSNASIAKYNINKPIDDMVILETVKEYSNKGFAEDDVRDKTMFGNFNAWSKVEFALPPLGDSYISEAVINGEFNFYYYKTRNWTSSDYLAIGSLVVMPHGVCPDVDTEDYDGSGVGVTFKGATAKKLIVKYNSDKKTTSCIFYDENNNEVNPSKLYDKNGKIIPYCCSANATASFEDGKLKINFPATTAKIYVPYEQPQEEGLFLYKWNLKETDFHTADIVIEHMDVYYYQQGNKGDIEFWDEQNRSDFITRNSLKTWYGGTNSGYSGGTRLFVAGHPEFKNVLRWSNVNDSSYFLENNFSYIGRDDELITALGKQDGYLVVFKEHELYALEYTYTTDSEDKALIYFPVTPISPYIGCDCPDTIQLIANRLTWLSSDGKVYTLYSENSYNERNVRELSHHIENDLKKHSKAELQSAKSVDYDNNYFVFVGKTAYIWNYDINPFYNYTSSEQAQKKLAWFKWDFPYPVEYAYNVNGQLVVICKDGAEYQGYVLEYDTPTDEGMGTGSNTAIKTEYKSKLFNFGKPFSFKKIDRAFFEIEANSQGDFSLYFFTENGRDESPSIISAVQRTKSNAYSVRPYLRRVRSAGFEIESTTPIKLLSANMTAEIYGEVK